MMNITNNFPQPNKSKSGFQASIENIRQLPPKQLIGLVFVLLMLPMVVTAALHQVLIGSKAWFPKPYPITPPVQTPVPTNMPITPPVVPGDDPNYSGISYPKYNPIVWKTPYAFLTAESFYVEVNGKKFVGNNDFIVKSDPPNNTNPDVMTLEVTWFENNTEMRIYMYFDKLNGNWWTNNIRTYDGTLNSPDWIFYNSPQSGSAYFAHMINHSFWHMDDYVIASPDGRGKIVFRNVLISAFTDQQWQDVDINDDGYVDLLDYNVLVRDYGKDDTNSPADLNGDYRVDLIDYNILISWFGQSTEEMSY